jgi:hypothetical protein
MGTGSNGQGSGGGKDGNSQGNKPSRSGAQNTTRRKVSFCMDYNEEPAPAKTLRFIEKGFDLTPSPFRNRYDGNRRSRHHDARARRRAAQEKPQERSRQNETVSIQSRSWNGWRRCRYRNAEVPRYAVGWQQPLEPATAAFQLRFCTTELTGDICRGQSFDRMQP